VFQWTHGRVGLTVERQQFLGLACAVTFNKSGAGPEPRGRGPAQPCCAASSTSRSAVSLSAATSLCAEKDREDSHAQRYVVTTNVVQRVQLGLALAHLRAPFAMRTLHQIQR
jgi:hypothetical protein